MARESASILFFAAVLCRNVFVLAPTPSLAARFPDDSIPWSSVFEIVVPSSQPDAVTCPICIEPPKVPRITQCGHVLCYACIARLLQPGVAKCPICSKIVHEADLRRARIRDLGRNSVSALLSNSLDGTKPAADGTSKL